MAIMAILAMGTANSARCGDFFRRYVDGATTALVCRVILVWSFGISSVTVGIDG